MVIRQPDRMWQPAFPPRDSGLWDLRLVHSTWRDLHHGRFAARERSAHRHDVYHVVPIVTGTGTFVAPEGPVAVAAPYLFLIAPGQEHSFTGGPGEDSVYSELTFAGESAPGVPLRAPWSALLSAWFQGPCPVNVHGPVPAACVSAIDRAIADVTTLGHDRHPQAEGYARATIHQILAVIWRYLVAQPAEPEDPAVHARRILDDRLDDPPSSAELAALVGWPSKRLARVFAARYGMPPGQYRLHAVMERAADLLRATALPMAEIAERLGYPDVRFFIRQFGKVHGVPPATWRRRSE